MMSDNKLKKNSSCFVKARRGRPPQMCLAAREAAILRATAQLLLEIPFDDVTMSLVARTAGMSKRTVYEIFKSREDLLVRAVINLARTIFLPLKAEDAKRPLSERLSLLLRFNAPSGEDMNKLELLRSVIAKAQTYPVLAHELYTSGRGTLVGFVRAELESAIASGEISLPQGDIDMAVEILLDMALENPLTRLLQPHAQQPSDLEVERRREFAIAMFLRGIAP
ncbi:TetR/AcrR family transcriptional regulator [Celeribacter sp.]|uniref:TetR/AcrR family transcriptional regulator n=1 Tax=Celeribacter sp. TaxID=1890673 RepID=UPI003A90A749